MEIQVCQNCNQLLKTHAHGLCSKCYFQEHNQKSEVRERKRKWMIEYLHRKNPSMKYRHLHSDVNPKDRERFGGNRETVLKRDNFKCQKCGVTKQLIVHHKDGTSYRMNPIKVNNSLDNLLTLCSACHFSHHNKGRSHPLKVDILLAKGIITPESVMRGIYGMTKKSD